MNSKPFIFLISILIGVSHLSAQNIAKMLQLEVSAGLQFNHRNLAASAGLHFPISTHLNVGLFAATDPMGHQEIKPLIQLSELGFSNATVNHKPVYGFEIKYYQHKNQPGFFIGSGIYSGAYKIDSFSFTQKENNTSSNIGGNISGSQPNIIRVYHRRTAQDKYFGITNELGYLLPIKKGRFEASLRIFKPFYQAKEIQRYEDNIDNITKTVSVKNGVRSIALNLQLRYVRTL